MKRDRHLFLIGLGLRLDLHFDDGVREVHLLEDDGLLGIAQRLARARVFQTLQGDDVARECFLDFFALGYGVPLMISAYVTRFLIRRLPVIG
jgi:hypothetical protein